MGNKIQKSIMRWMNAPANTYPNIDKTFSRLQRLVMGDFVIKDFDQDETVSESEVTMWVSRGRGDDETGNGSFEKPYYTIQKAIDEAVARGGHRLHKTINIEARYKSRREIYFPFICRTRNITIRGVGGVPKIYGNFPALGDEPPTAGYDTDMCIFTNMTEAGLTSFVEDGGIDYTLTSSSFTWDGGNFFGHELDLDLSTDTPSYSSFKYFNANIVLENLNFRALNPTSLGPKTPSIAFLYGGNEDGDQVSVYEVKIKDCEIQGPSSTSPSLFANNIRSGSVSNTELSANSGGGPAIVNCSHSLGENGSNPNRYGGSDLPVVVACDGPNGIGGVVNSTSHLKNMKTDTGLLFQVTGGDIGTINGLIENTNSSNVALVGNIRADKYTSIKSKGPVLIDISYTPLNVFHHIFIYSSLTHTNGNTAIRGGEINGDFLINGGTVSVDGATIRGNLVVADGATIDFTNVTVKGNVTLGATSVVTGWKGGSYYGTLTDNGTHTFPAAGTLMNK